uniref:Uncharacterized protein n=1 Tax=Ascaris lumbricoides TaxID=6252 RepID=A0A0M3IB35_ASCLU
MRYVLLFTIFFMISVISEGRYIQESLSYPSRRAYNFADFVSLPLWSGGNQRFFFFFNRKAFNYSKNIIIL